MASLCHILGIWIKLKDQRLDHHVQELFIFVGNFSFDWKTYVIFMLSHFLTPRNKERPFPGFLLIITQEFKEVYAVSIVTSQQFLE